MKVTLSKYDFESLTIVILGISALKLTLAQILNVEDVAEVIRKGLGDYFEKREELLNKGKKFLDGYNLKLSELYKTYGEGSKNPAILAFTDEGEKFLDKEINKPLKELGNQKIDIDIPQEMFVVLKDIFTKEAFFGKNGYSDNESGKSAYSRTIKALGIKTEELPTRTGASELSDTNIGVKK
jgi:hypothetical protein